MTEPRRQLDVRTPLGLMFSVLGALLSVFGLVSDRTMYKEHSLGININLDWGLVLFAFGAVMFGLSRRKP